MLGVRYPRRRRLLYRDRAWMTGLREIGEMCRRRVSRIMGLTYVDILSNYTIECALRTKSTRSLMFPFTRNKHQYEDILDQKNTS
jgi:hypothetical protein